METTESYMLVFCGSPQPFYADLEKLLKNHLTISFVYLPDKITSLDTFDLEALVLQHNHPIDLPIHFIFFGIEESVAIEEPQFKHPDKIIEQQNIQKKVTFIPICEQWLNQLDDHSNTFIDWNTVELQQDKLTPIEHLLNAFGYNTRLRLEKIDKGFKPLLDYVYNKTRITKQSISLATKLASEDELHFRALDDLAFVTLPVSDKAHLFHALLLLRRRKQNQAFAYRDYAAIPVFSFFYDEGDSFPLVKSPEEFESLSLDSFSFYANKKTFDKVSSTFDKAGIQFLNTESNETGFICQLDVDCLNRVLADPLNKMISQASLTLMGTNRLVNHYSCSFYLPLDVGGNIYNNPLATNVHPVNYDNGKEDFNTAQAQALLYFHPPVRDHLFDTGSQDEKDQLQPIREWKMDNLGDADQSTYQWCVYDPVSRKNIIADVTSVRLYQYFNQLCLLEISVKSTDKSNANAAFKYDDEYWWHSVAFCSPELWHWLKTRQINDWLLFTRLARVLYPSFTQQEDKAKIAENYLTKSSQECDDTRTKIESNDLTIDPLSRENFSNLILYFLKQFFSTSELNETFNNHCQYSFDEQLFVNVAYGYNAPQLDKESSDRLFKLALYVDSASDTFDAFDGHAYDPDFLDNVVEKHRYNRWQAMGTLPGYCNYSNAYLGYGYFFNDVIAKNHVPLIYGRMLLMTLFHQASLHLYNKKVSQLTEHLNLTSKSTPGEYKKIQLSVSELRKNFIRFTNVFWLHDITSQTQGQEVFNLQQQALELKREYGLIKDKMDRMDEFLQGRYNLSMQKKTSDFNWLMLLLTVPVITLATLKILENDLFVSLSSKLWQFIGL